MQTTPWREAEPQIDTPDYGAPQPRPLDLLVVGGLLAAGTFMAVLAVAYKAWYANELDQNTAIFLMGVLFFLFTGGVYIFCYGWERGDVARAVRLTVIVVVLAAVAVLAVVIILAVLAKSKGGGGSSSTAASAGEASEGDGMPLSLGGILRTAGSYVDDGTIRLDEPAREQGRTDFVTVPCGRCQARYVPIPPRAECPQCGWAAVTVA